MNIGFQTKMLVIFVLLFLCGNAFADNLNIPVGDLNSVSTFKKMVKYSECVFRSNPDTHSDSFLRG